MKDYSFKKEGNNFLSELINSKVALVITLGEKDIYFSGQVSDISDEMLFLIDKFGKRVILKIADIKKIQEVD